MRNIKMTMPKMQLNSKFVNSMLPEWGRFVTTVKLDRGLKISNHDQMYAYLKKHEAHANENKMMLERYNQHATDPLAFNGVVLDEEQLLFIVGGHTNTFDDDVDEAQAAQCVSANEQNKVVNELLTAELARYKEQVTIYEKGQEDALEIAEKTKKKMLEKMKSPLAENAKVKQHDKELYDSIKITHAKTIEKITSLLTENEKLKARLKGKMKCVAMNAVKPKVLAPEYVIGTCSKEFSKREKKVATTPLNRKKKVTFKEPCETLDNNTQTHVEKQKVQKTNVLVIPSTGVNSSTKASGSKPKSNTKNNRILPAKSDNKKKVEAHPRNK
nr:integrase, catalytic region, zinc finger, CCHC-type, peptidase aspartic, catalytic [Tanacetum cinerariifolium]